MTGIDPWRHVDADDDLVADFLAGTVEVVHEVGGWIHPELRIMARDGYLWVEADVSDGEPLVHLPAEAFIPISRVTWDDGSTLAFHDEHDELSPVQSELLVLQIALHNACHKLPTLMSTHPAVADDLSDEVIEAVRALKPDFRVEARSTVSMFWSNRVLRIPPKEGAAPEPMALPIVDLLDHRRGGATGTWTGDGFAVTAAHAGRAPGCFLDYGYERDALDFALDYGFVDDSDLARTRTASPEELNALHRLIDCAESSASPAAAILVAVARLQLEHVSDR